MVPEVADSSHDCAADGPPQDTERIGYGQQLPNGDVLLAGKTPYYEAACRRALTDGLRELRDRGAPTECFQCHRRSYELKYGLCIHCNPVDLPPMPADLLPLPVDLAEKALACQNVSVI
jgi:hypothetical protein